MHCLWHDRACLQVEISTPSPGLVICASRMPTPTLHHVSAPAAGPQAQVHQSSPHIWREGGFACCSMPLMISRISAPAVFCTCARVHSDCMCATFTCHRIQVRATRLVMHATCCDALGNLPWDSAQGALALPLAFSFRRST